MKPRRRDLHNARDPYANRTLGEPIAPETREERKRAENGSRDLLAALYRYGMRHRGLAGPNGGMSAKQCTEAFRIMPR